MPPSDRAGTAALTVTAFNGADVRYLRGSLQALRDVRRASDAAAAAATDPRVRDLARRAGATQADQIGVITSMLRGSGREAGADRAGAVDQGSLDGLEIDRRFLEVLTAHAKASLVSARAEMVEGFGGSSRRHAEDISRAGWRELAELRLLASATGEDQARVPPAPVV